MSIIGHIVGLGDRHVSNILMDEVSGDLVAIDLGIAFDAVSLGSVTSRSMGFSYLFSFFFPLGYSTTNSRNSPFPTYTEYRRWIWYEWC